MSKSDVELDSIILGDNKNVEFFFVVKCITTDVRAVLTKNVQSHFLQAALIVHLILLTRSVGTFNNWATKSSNGECLSTRQPPKVEIDAEFLLQLLRLLPLEIAEIDDIRSNRSSAAMNYTMTALWCNLFNKLLENPTYKNHVFIIDDFHKT